jgi:hypothetical protein
MKIFPFFSFIILTVLPPLFAGGGAVQSACAYSSCTLNASDRDFLLELEKRSFNYFAEQADPETGLVNDRARFDGTLGGGIASSAATGFGLSALCIGASHGWMSRTEAERRAKLTLEFMLEKAPQVHGWFYHFTSLADGERRWNSEVSSIDTALFLTGALTAAGCFADDKDIPALAEKIYARTDFKWMMAGGDLLSMGWYPESGFLSGRWDTHSEQVLLELLAIGAPQYPAPPQMWQKWRRDTVSYSSYTYISANAPLFIHQYPQAWFDLRGMRDSVPPHEDFFANSVAATLAHRDFCVDMGNKFPSYSKDIWGITASDGSDGYHAWGGPPATPDIDGTVVPCAAGGSLMFTPEAALATLKMQREKYGDKIWGPYGFADAFNPKTGWVGPDNIGIDVGMTLLSAENLLTGDIWKWFMSNPEPNKALELTGLKKQE